MKRAAAIFLAAVIAAMNLNFAHAAEDCALVEWSSVVPSLTNVANLQNVNTMEETTADGESAVKMSGSRVNIDIASSFMRRLKNGEGVDVTVRYFDQGDGSFVLEYDGRKDKCENTEAVWLTDSGEWKTHVFHIYDAYFSNRLYNADLSLCLSSDAVGTSKDSVIFKSVRIEKSGKVFPINMSENPITTGNIFTRGEKAVIGFSAENISDENIRSEYEFSVVDSYGETVKTGSGVMNFKPGANNISIASEVTTCGAYEMNVKFFNNENLFGEVQSNFAIVTDAEENPDYGQNTHYRISDRDPEKSLPLVKKMGSYMVRDEYRWAFCEKEKGKVEILPEWITLADSAKEKGLKLVVILGYTNPLYDDGKFPKSKDGLAAFGNYVYEVVSALKGKVDTFEVYNEFHHNKEGLDASYYVKLLKVTYEQAKKANPDCTIVGLGGLPGVWAYWVDNMLKAGAADYMDALSLHEYDAYGNPERKMMGWIKTVKQYMQDNGCADMPIWITETGWSTGNITSDGTKLVRFSEKAQYANGIRQYVQYKELGVSKYFWYDFKNDGMNRRDVENSYGTIYNNNDRTNTPYAAKPAYVAFTNMNDMLANTSFVSHTTNGDGTEVYKFRKNSGGDVWVLWNVNGETNTEVSTGKSGLVFYDVFGNAKKVPETKGTYSVKVSEEPTYLAAEKDPAANIAEINYQTGEISVTAVGLDTKKYCAVQVLKPGMTAADVYTQKADAAAYMAQPTGRVYRFKFDAEREGVYDIYINNGSELVKIGAAYYKPFEVKLTAWQGENEIKMLSEADLSKPVTIRAEIDNTLGSDSGISFACAGYKGGKLSGVSASESTRLDSAKTSDTLEIELENISELDKIKAFFWKDGTRLIPVTDKFEIK